MPSLRLTVDDARDIASYLMTQKHANASFPPADFMDDPNLKQHGKELIQHYGCAGCHEISGLEDEGRVGTELTNEGSKPIERLDFALLTEDAKLGACPTARSPLAASGTTSRVSLKTSSPIRRSSIAANTSPIRWIGCACRSPTSTRKTSTR